MEFEWDDAKSDACFADRGFDFAYARTHSWTWTGAGTTARTATGCRAR